MPSLDDLVRREVGERVLGAYLYPVRVFGGTPATAIEATKVLAEIDTGEELVLLTRCGGMFVTPPATYRDAYRTGAGGEAFASGEVELKTSYTNHVAEVFNLLVCELALRGHVYEPVSPLYVLYGRRTDDYATIVVGGGSGPINMDRQMGPLLALFERRWNQWPGAPDSLPAQIANLPMSRALARVSGALPTLVAGAYWHYSVRQFAESVADSWIVTEQLLESMWQEFVADVSPERRGRLRDRSFTTSIRAEMLHSVGRMQADVYGRVQAARVQRNALMHAASVSQDAASSCMSAMRALVGRVVGQVAEALPSSAILW